ncbi:MAG: hypothetical protein LUE29_01525 [Lachnospiraceae bacterium]|nr:hypothetical protein [Lachnospiraceae bacterium]
MTDYYMRDGRYFGEDTSFYEFDKDCLDRKGGWEPENKNMQGTDHMETSDHGYDAEHSEARKDSPVSGLSGNSGHDFVSDPTKASRHASDPEYGACSCESGSPESAAKGAVNDKANGTAKDASNGAANGTARNASNGAANGTARDASNGAANGTARDASNGAANGTDPPENFDRLFTNRKLDMLKTAIPFLPARRQKVFSCAVKLAEFRNLIGFFGQQQPTLLGACSDGDPGMRMADMLDALRGYCSPAEQEQIDSLFQVLMTVQMMRDGI